MSYNIKKEAAGGRGVGSTAHVLLDRYAAIVLLVADVVACPSTTVTAAIAMY
jgi:hypothetical protein